MSRGGPRQGDWSLHPELIAQVWSRFGRAEVDLFAAHGNAQCELWFSLSAREHPPLGVDAFAHRPWPRGLLYAFPPVPLIPRFLDRVQEERLSVILIAPERTGASWFPCLQRTLSGRPWEIPWRGGRSLTGGGSDLQSPSDRPALMGMAPEREHLESWGLSQDVVRTIQGTRAASTRASYTAKSAAFQRWCVGRSLDPMEFGVQHNQGVCGCHIILSCGFRNRDVVQSPPDETVSARGTKTQTGVTRTGASVGFGFGVTSTKQSPI
ncbi:hypothetical protein CgunFtcFv8_025841 [Champsocephalus gunnari]|uniref:Uncharacterized protein n=1 Tax=Champsocephalus gunnari TaxID=52237 RepID=A0AAN8H397_CHAGU|nr:hypothetical protein CgunFtcFv8_025841 [Champsocephalus gunnari]